MIIITVSMDKNYNSIYGYFCKMDTILEPMTCILRIILLNYKEKGTKISISNNSIQYNPPTMYQGLIRGINRDKREDLHNLYNPILKSFEWYPINDKNKHYIYFYNKCSQGINILLDTYEKNTIIYYALQHYNKLINESLSSKVIIESSTLNDNDNSCFNKIKNIWKSDELNIIYNILIFIENNGPQKEVYIKVIDDIINMKEKEIQSILSNHTIQDPNLGKSSSE